MPTKKLMGRPTIYGPKDAKKRFQGITTEAGAKMFEGLRRELVTFTGIKNPSDGDVIEYAARAMVDADGGAKEVARLKRKFGK